ncbi:REP-associated tyrosine transposase [Adhaeretor mobilis]|nr:transposase [Adhaeretor mobilis]
MPNYRRFFVPGGTFFFTLKTERNAPIFSQAPNVKLLGDVFRETKSRWPFEVNAVVLLPDHLHTIWSLPGGDANYSTRWAWLKKEFTKRYLDAGGVEQPTSLSRDKNRRRGVWQRRFWEHTCEDVEDFEAHFDYLHWNPVKHGYVECPHQWPHSSFHRWVGQGVYAKLWGCGTGQPKSAASVDDAGE